MRVRGTAVAVSLTLGFIAPSWASAHARLDGSEPAAEAVLAAPPQRVELDFSAKVSFAPDSVRLLDRGGKVVASGSGKADDKVGLDVPAGLEPGSYIVSWQATDDHSSPLSGSLNFHVGAAPAQPAVVAPPRPGRTAGDELDDLSTVGAIVSLATLLGAGFVLFIRPSPQVRTGALSVACSAAACALIGGAGVLAFGGDAPPAKNPTQTSGVLKAQLSTGADVELSITPPRVGAPRFTVSITATNGQPDFGTDKVTAILTPLDRTDLGAFTVDLPKRKPGGFEPDLVTFPFSGRWRVELSIDQDEFTSERLRFIQEVTP